MSPEDPHLHVLLTGSTAPYAEMLSAALVGRGHDVTVVESSRTDHIPPVYASYSLVAETEELRTAVAKADVTVLLTGLGPLLAMVDDAAAIDVVLGSASPGSSLIQVSPLGIFGNMRGQIVTEETIPTPPDTFSPMRAAEVRVLTANDWLRTAVIRTGLTYGPLGGQVLSEAVDLARALGVSHHFGERDDLYPLVHEEDLVAMVVAIIEQEGAREVFHAVTTNQSAGLLAALIADAADVQEIRPWDAGALNLALSVSSFPPRINVSAASTRNAELGWTPAAPGLGEEFGRIERPR